MCGNVVRNEVIKKHPELSNIFKKLSGLITDQDMAQMNYEVETCLLYTSLVESIINWGVLAIIIIFQPEIRTLLEKMGQTKMTLKKEISDDEKERLIDVYKRQILTCCVTGEGAAIQLENYLKVRFESVFKDVKWLHLGYVDETSLMERIEMCIRDRSY